MSGCCRVTGLHHDERKRCSDKSMKNVPLSTGYIHHAFAIILSLLGTCFTGAQGELSVGVETYCNINNSELNIGEDSHPEGNKNTCLPKKRILFFLCAMYTISKSD